MHNTPGVTLLLDSVRVPLSRAPCQHGGKCALTLTHCGGCGTQKNKYRSLKVRTASTLVLIGSFFAFIWAGHVPLMLMIFGIQARGPPVVRTTWEALSKCNGGGEGGKFGHAYGGPEWLSKRGAAVCGGLLTAGSGWERRRSKKLAPCMQHWQKGSPVTRSARHVTLKRQTRWPR